MILYFPESKGQTDLVGYNHAIKLFRKALSYYVSDFHLGVDYRMYCNLPWHHAPKELKGNKPLFVYTMYESTRLPSAWVKFLNKYADVIAVPSQFCKDVFLECGVKKPIGILSLGFDTDEVLPAFKRNLQDEYIFLWQGVAFDPNGRKGVDIAVQAFRELKNDGCLSNAKLILKYHCGDGIQMNGVEDTQGVTYLQKDYTREQMNNLYKKVDCCINPTRGEGFGLIPLEQMAMGKPTIVTEFSIPYIKLDYCLPISYRLEQSPIFWNHKFLSISKNGLVYNFGGLPKEIQFLPKLLTLKPNGKNIISIPPALVCKEDILKNNINNLLLSLQKKTGLYFSPQSKAFKLYQENTGMDATADIDSLKYHMLWCYNNRTQAYAMGVRAREYVLREWSLDKMKLDFKNNILPLLERGLYV
jgi:hypothetical protein